MSAGRPLRLRAAQAGRLSRRSHPGRRDGGAAAVEFALVAPLLFLVLFGIIDYGIWFADSIGLRQGVRESARSAVVGRFSGSCAGSDLSTVACSMKRNTTTISGNISARLRVLDANGNATTTWTFGNTLRVCAVQSHDALLPLVPLPDSGNIRSRVDMSIEALPQSAGGAPAPATATSATVTSYTGDADPSGANWSWC